jgi:hypothetical protein
VFRVIRFIVAIAHLALCSFSASTQTRFEIQPFVGYKFGGADVGPYALFLSRINIDSSIAYGVTATFNPSEHTGIEFLWNHQPTNASGAQFALDKNMMKFKVNGTSFKFMSSPKPPYPPPRNKRVCVDLDGAIYENHFCQIS